MDYASQIASAKKLIDKYGGPATLVVTTTVEGADEWSPEQDSEQRQDVMAVFLNYSRVSMFAQSYEQGTLIQQGDKRVLIAAQGLTIVPNVQGRIERSFNGKLENWKIVGIDPLNVDSQHPILYAMQVRQ
jgi:hypothetical protein